MEQDLWDGINFGMKRQAPIFAVTRYFVPTSILTVPGIVSIEEGYVVGNETNNTRKKKMADVKKMEPIETFCQQPR